MVTKPCGAEAARPTRIRTGSFRRSDIVATLLSMSRQTLTRDDVVRALLADERAIRDLGVAQLALFGSVLRGTATPASDVDLLVRFIPGGKSYDRLLALSELLESRLGRRVELLTTEGLSPFIGPHILAEAEDVFRAA
jgi:uncharacterized protein